MFCGACPGQPLESNGLRVRTRVGFGPVQRNYGATYRSVQEALHHQVPRGSAGLVRAHLRSVSNGKELCRNNAPLCQACQGSHLCSFPMK